MQKVQLERLDCLQDDFGRQEEEMSEDGGKD